MKARHFVNAALCIPWNLASERERQLAVAAGVAIQEAEAGKQEDAKTIARLQKELDEAVERRDHYFKDREKGLDELEKENKRRLAAEGALNHLRAELKVELGGNDDDEISSYDLLKKVRHAVKEARR